MRICMVLFSDGMGGAETVVFELVCHLSMRGHSLTVVTNHELRSFFESLPGVNVIDIGSTGYGPFGRSFSHTADSRSRISSSIVTLVSEYERELAADLCLLRASNVVNRFLGRGTIDVIHSHMSEADVFVSRLRRGNIPWLTTLHGEHRLRGSTPVHPTLRPLVIMKAARFRSALQQVNAISAVSRSELALIRDWGVKVQGRSEVIYNGVNLEDARRGTDKEFVPVGDFNMLFPGGSKWSKGGDILIDAMGIVSRKAPHVHLYVASRVDSDSMLRRRVTQYGLHESVTFLGFLQRKEYDRILSAMDILVMPSRREGFPLAVLEAMAKGKAILATSAGGIPEIVRDGRNGILVELDAERIAEAILMLSDRSDLVLEYGSNNLLDVAQFDWNLVCDKYVGTYSELVAGRASTETLNQRANSS